MLILPTVRTVELVELRVYLVVLGPSAGYIVYNFGSYNFTIQYYITCDFTRQELVWLQWKMCVAGTWGATSTTKLDSDVHVQGKDSNFLQQTVVGASHLHKVCASRVGGTQEYEERKLISRGVSQRLKTHLSILCCLKYWCILKQRHRSYKPLKINVWKR